MLTLCVALFTFSFSGMGTTTTTNTTTTYSSSSKLITANGTLAPCLCLLAGALLLGGMHQPHMASVERQFACNSVDIAAL